MAYVPPYPIFQIQTHSITTYEGDPTQDSSSNVLTVAISAQHLHSSGADVSWWVSSDDPLPYWPDGNPQGSLHLSGNGVSDFTLPFAIDNTPSLDVSFTLNFYPGGGATMAGSGSVAITILDDDSPYNGDDGDNVITASSAADAVNARGGNDQVKAGGGADQVSGGGGNDDVSGGTGRDFIRGDTGDDILSGGHASDVLYGGLGNDTINGGTRNDFVDGGSGVDVLSGGSGADTFKIDYFYGTTEITDFTSGTDKIEISMADWHVPGGTLHFQNRASPTLDTAELYFVAADHTLHYAPYGGSDDGSPIQSYLVATLDGVTSLSISDFDFVP